jgi:hypothetical protein
LDQLFFLDAQGLARLPRALRQRPIDLWSVPELELVVGVDQLIWGEPPVSRWASARSSG